VLNAAFAVMAAADETPTLVVVVAPAIAPNSVPWLSGRYTLVTLSFVRNPVPSPDAEASAITSGRTGMVVVPLPPVPWVPVLFTVPIVRLATPAPAAAPS